MKRPSLARYLRDKCIDWPTISQLHVISLLALPALLPFVRRSGPPLLILLAFSVIIARVRTKAAWSGASFSPTVLAFCALFVWGTISLSWSPLPHRGSLQLLAAAAVFASGFVLLSAEIQRLSANFHKFFAASLTLGALIVTIDIISGLPLASIVRNNEEAHRYNMIIVSLLILCWGLPARDDVPRAWILTAWFSVAIATFTSESESAKLALIASAGVWAVCALFSRKALVLLAGLIIAACWVSAPWIGALIDGGIGLVNALPEAAHAHDRVVIWRGGGAAALAFIPWGAGAGSALAFAEDALRYGKFEGLGWGHTHNNFLQVWLELGLPGVLLGVVACLAIWRASAVLREEPFRRAYALAAAICVIALVSHGLWQVWFWAAVFAAAIISHHASEELQSCVRKTEGI